MTTPLRGQCSNCETPALAVTLERSGGLCIPCARKRPHHTEQSRLLANQELWSEESRRLRSYEPGAEVYYYNEYYWCANCEAACVFTALEQKQVFEAEKRHIYTTRSLCDRCHKESGRANA
jgi:hypothetical protein